MLCNQKSCSIIFYSCSIIFYNIFLSDGRDSSSEDEPSSRPRNTDVNIAYDTSLPALHSVSFYLKINIKQKLLCLQAFIFNLIHR